METGGQGAVSRLSDQTSCPGATAGQGVNAGEPQRAPGHAAPGSTGGMRQGGAGGGGSRAARERALLATLRNLGLVQQAMGIAGVISERESRALRSQLHFT